MLMIAKTSEIRLALSLSLSIYIHTIYTHILGGGGVISLYNPYITPITPGNPLLRSGVVFSSTTSLMNTAEAPARICIYIYTHIHVYTNIRTYIYVCYTSYGVIWFHI